MPVFKSDKGLAPAWCELEYFEIVRLKKGQSHSFERAGKKEKLIVAEGACTITFGGKTLEAEKGANLDIEKEGDSFVIKDVTEDAVIVRMCGRWGDETGGSGPFSVKEGGKPPAAESPINYPKTTSFDNHYHDCDEYWIIYEGTGVVYTEGKRFEVGPGHCVATGMGFHHDFPEVACGPVKAVYFETTMEGAARGGHLNEPTHGKPEPKMGRI